MAFAIKRRLKQNCFLEQSWQFNVLNRINESVLLGLHDTQETRRRSLSFPCREILPARLAKVAEIAK